MNLAFKIARRYLFAKKTTQAINVISGISVFGLALGSAALILVLSVFNGFEHLIAGMMRNFNPDIKITATKGKTFVSDTALLAKVRACSGVLQVSESLEEIAFFEYEKSQAFGLLKGVDAVFTQVNRLDTAIQEGQFLLADEASDYAVLGAGIRNQLGVYERNFIPLSVYMPRRETRFVLGQEKPFEKRFLYPKGSFAIQQEFDNQYIITNLAFVRDILEAPDEASAWEIKTAENADPAQVAQNLRVVLGPDFVVKDRYQQDEAFLKLMNVEKWMSYAILSLTVLLVAFNMVGCLWMVVLEKKKDIAILKSMGASNRLIKAIFLNEGLLLCLLGLSVGFILALVLYGLHVYTEGGLVPLPEGFATDRYPLALKALDFVIVSVTVIVIGVLAALPAALRAERVDTIIRED